MKKRLYLLLSIFIIALTLASCTGKSFSVEFDLNGGDSTSINTQTIKEGNLVEKPDTPLKEGHTFDFWLDEQSNDEWDFEEDAVIKDLKLVAKWTINKYLVTFNSQSGTPLPDDQVVIHGEKALLPEVEPSLDNNGFLGWYLEDTEYDFDLPVEDNLTLIAKWAKEHTVSFDFNDDLSTSETQTVLFDHLILKPTNPSKEGYQFLGWHYINDANETVLWNFSDPVSEDLNLFAQWLSIEEHVNVDLDALEFSIEDGKINFPERGPINNVRLSWSSSDPLTVTNKGIVNPPLKLQGDKEVILTATGTYAKKSFTKDFPVTIEAKGEPVVTLEKELEFKNLTNEYEVLDTSIDAYYVDDGNIPYLDIESFLMLLNGLLYSEELVFNKNDQILDVSYTVTDEDEQSSYDFSATIDLFEDTISVDSNAFFSYYIQSTATDYSQGINYLDTYVEEGSPILFDLGKYQVDMFVHEVGDVSYYLVPYNFLSMIFISESYYNFYYNGDSFYGFYAIPSSNDENDEFQTYETIKTSSLNNTQIDKDVALSSINQLAFIFDYYFGLRNEEYYGIIDSFYEKIENNIDNYLTSTRSFDDTLRNFVLKTIDELHSSYSFPGYYNRPSFSYPLYIDHLGSRVINWYEDGLWEVQDSINYWHQGEHPDYLFLDESKESALIYLDSFLTASVDEEKTKENDSDQFMKETLQAIHSENPNVKNIGIDLSYNTGGNVGALLRVLGYITEKPIEMSNQNTLDGEKTTYHITLDTDAYEDVNWFFITSPVTFSAANMMTAIVKNQDLGLIIGSTSGGGAASITPFVLAQGSMISISSNSLSSIRVTNSDNSYSYHSIEDGVEPDVYLEPINTQNTETILDLITEHLN